MSNPVIGTSLTGAVTNVSITNGGSGYSVGTPGGPFSSVYPSWADPALKSMLEQAEASGIFPVKERRHEADEKFVSALADAMVERDGGTRDDHMEDAQGLAALYRATDAPAAGEMVMVDSLTMPVPPAPRMQAASRSVHTVHVPSATLPVPIPATAPKKKSLRERVNAWMR